jgi:hypothetical protein
MEWIEEFIARLEQATNGILKVEIGGQPVVAQISSDLIAFFKQNRALLVRVGKETFRSFLVLISERKEEQAFNLLLAKMDADDIILRMEMNAQELQQLNATKEEFLVVLRKFLVSTMLPMVAKVLFALLV